MHHSISVVIPAFNEEKVISKTLIEIQEYLHEHFNDFEIIVVADGSKDGTIKVVQEFRDVRLLINSTNRGKGNAVKKGILSATKDYVLFMDADHAVSISYLEEFFKFSDQSPVVIASKYLNKEIGYPWHRKLVGKLFSYLKKKLIGLTIKDTQCGFKLFEKKVAQGLFEKSKIEGWCFDVEILMLAAQCNIPVQEVAVSIQNTDRASKINIFRSGIQMLRDLLKLRIAFLKGHYPTEL